MPLACAARRERGNGLVRYTLAFTLFSYGFAKVFPLQFQPPALTSSPWQNPPNFGSGTFGLTKDEARGFNHIVRRIAAVVLLEPELDKNYLATKAQFYPWPTSFSSGADDSFIAVNV